MKKCLCILYIITIFIFTSCVEAEFEYFDNCTYYNNEFYCKTKTHEDLEDNNGINKNLENNSVNNSVNITEIIISSGKEKPSNDELNTEKDFYFSNIEELYDNQSLLIEIPYIIYNDVQYLDYYGLLSFSINTDKTFSVILYDIDVNIDDLMNSSKKANVKISINTMFSNEVNKLINELLGDWPHYFFSLKEIIYKNNRLELVYSITSFIIV